ncbi:MAG: helicase-related protein [Candidatus Dojkabacteria bacterium]|nr:helicase-related protein [Candidatus Dojkabacteria bacterium]
METERDKRQREAIDCWKRAGLVGTIDGCVGFGKTIMTINWVIKPAFEKFPNLKCALIVPNNDLVNQWKEKLFGYPVVVRTVNSFINKPAEEWDLIIYDEIHKYLKGERFSEVLRYKSKWKLGLSGTLTPQTREILKLFHLPVVDTIPLDYSIEKNWNNNYQEYNLKVYMTKEESELIKYWDKKYYNILAFLGQGEIDYKVLKKILFRKVIGYQQKDGQIVTYKSGKRKGQPIPINHYPYAEELAKELNVPVSSLIIAAARANKIIRDRKKFFYSYPGKIEVIKKILEKFSHRKIIVFTMEREFCDKAALICNSQSYHGGYTNKKRREIIEKFKKAESGSLFACLALNEGVDIPNLDFCINASYYSTEETNTQRKGRVVRLTSYKRKAIIVNLVTCFHPSVPGLTQEERWLRKFQATSGSKPITIRSYEEISEI